MALHDTGSYFHLKESGISSQEVFNSNNKDSQGYYRAKLNPPPPKKNCSFKINKGRYLPRVLILKLIISYGNP